MPKKTKEKTYTVYLLTTYCKWEGVKATTEQEAINQCEEPAEFDFNEPGKFIAIEEED